VIFHSFPRNPVSIYGAETQNHNFTPPSTSAPLFSFLHFFLIPRFQSKCRSKFDCKLLKAEVRRRTDSMLSLRGFLYFAGKERRQVNHIILTYLFTYLLTYLLTYSMEQSPSWEANRFSASQEIPRILWNRKFITAFTSVLHLSLS
jgi:hypothetical protein